MKLSLESVKYAMREGHFEAAPQFHVSQALLCEYLFNDSKFLSEVARALINHFNLLVRPALGLYAEGSAGICLASYINTELLVMNKNPMTIHTEDDWPLKIDTENYWLLRDRVYLILLPNVLKDYDLRRRLIDFKVRGVFVAGVGAICDRRQRKGDVDGVKVWAPIDLAEVGVNANLGVEPCTLCRKGELLTQGLRFI